MSLQIQLKKSAVTQKQPFASDLAVGELALNYNADGPFLTCKDTAGNVRKLNNVWVNATSPTGPSAGDLWLDISSATAVLKVYKNSTSTWVNATTIPIATTSVLGTVQLASSADIANGTSGKVVDAAQLQSKVTSEISSALSASPTTIQNLSVTDNAVIGGNLTVNGTTTTVSSETLLVEDKNIEMGVVATPTDTTADGGGITLKGATDKTLNWVNATDSWTSSENIDLASGKSYRINGTEVLSATALGSAVQISSANIPNGTIVDSDINAAAEIAVSKLADGDARQLLQTDAAGTGVEWTSNVDVPGTLDVTGAATFNSSVAVTGALTKSGNDVVTVGDTGTVTSTMIADNTIVNEDINSSAEIAVSKLADGDARQLLQTDAAGTGVEWTSNVDVPGTLDVTGATTLDSTLGVTGVISANGKVSFPLGSAAAPSLYPGSDTDTGIYSPAANELAISSNSSERIRIGANGEIGIGGANYGTSGQVLTSGGSGAAPSWTTITATTDKIEEGNTSAEVIDTGSDGRFVITTEGSERLRVDSSGRVGIGTTSPSTKLELAGDAATQLSIDANTGSGLRGIVFKNSGTAICQITHNASSGEFNIKAGSSGNGSNFITFGTDQGTERARIDSSGRLLVGTSSARANLNLGNNSAALQVEGTGFNSSNISIIRCSNDQGTPGLTLGHSRSSTVGGNAILANGDPIGFIYFEGADGTNMVRSAFIGAQVDGTPGANDMPGRLVFSTTADGASSPTERMRIGNTGALATFNSSANSFEVGNGQGAGTSTALYIGRHSAVAVNTGTNSIIIWTNGNVQNTNNSYGSLSDIKLKENIVDASTQWNDIKALQVRKYNFKEETGQQTHTQIGLIAQEVELVSPGLVTESPDRDEDGNDLGTVTKSVNYSVLYMKAVKALQEAMERIETLEAKVAALESA